MIYLKYNDNERFYYVFTNIGNNLILITRNGKLAMIVDAALRNKKDDSEYRMGISRGKRKAP